MPRNPPEPFNRFRTLADSSSSLDGSRFSWVAAGLAEVRDAPPPPDCEVDIIEICRRWAEMATVTFETTKRKR